MGNICFHSLQLALPEVYLAVMALFLLMVAATKCKTVCNAMLGGTLFSLAGTAWFIWPQLTAAPALAFNGMFAAGGFVAFAQLLVLTAAALAVLVGANWLKEGQQPSEFLALLLFATLGMLVMVSAADMLTLYLGLEMSSLALYVLAAFARDHAKSSEAGLKYFVLGALASGMLLFGISLVYGFAGSTNFADLAKLFDGGPPIAQVFAHSDEPVSRGVIVGMVLVVIGLCFKLSAVPFHMWTPDVYEGAPTPVAAFFATASKVAAFALFARVLMLPFGHLLAQWQQIVVFVSLASMIVGALGAIRQTNIKRLLAYSSIGHAGYVLMGLAAGNAAGVQAMLIYLAIYIFMSAGAFGCVLLMRRDGRYVEAIADLAGLGRTRPVLALTISAFMFSMAGIPPLAGFFAKWYVVLAAVSGGLAWLAVIGVLTSVIGGYYYIKVVKVMYFDEPAEALDAGTPCLLRTALAITSAFTLLYFLYPTPLVAQAKLAAEALLR